MRAVSLRVNVVEACCADQRVERRGSLAALSEPAASQDRLSRQSGRSPRGGVVRQTDSLESCREVTVSWPAREFEDRFDGKVRKGLQGLDIGGIQALVADETFDVILEKTGYASTIEIEYVA